jgi:hypothetical protein
MDIYFACALLVLLLSLIIIGLSFLFPSFCISEAKTRLLETLSYTNENIFNKRNLCISYKQKCSTSWLQIDILEKEDSLLNIDKKNNDYNYGNIKYVDQKTINIINNQIN